MGLRNFHWLARAPNEFSNGSLGAQIMKFPVLNVRLSNQHSFDFGDPKTVSVAATHIFDSCIIFNKRYQRSDVE
jgi:hypothetical protein